MGFAEILEIITEDEITAETKKWFGGKYGYVLSNVIKLKIPIKTTGARGVWNLKGKALKDSLSQLTEHQIRRIEKSLKQR